MNATIIQPGEEFGATGPSPRIRVGGYIWKTNPQEGSEFFRHNELRIRAYAAEGRDAGAVATAAALELGRFCLGSVSARGVYRADPHFVVCSCGLQPYGHTCSPHEAARPGDDHGAFRDRYSGR